MLGIPGDEVRRGTDLESAELGPPQSAEAPPAVAAVNASVAVIPSSVAPRPTTSGIVPKPP